MSACEHNDGRHEELVDNRIGRGMACMKGGQYQAALDDFLWCFDHGLDYSPYFGPVRLSFVLGYIIDLASSFPPARLALETRRDLFEGQLLQGTADPDLIQGYVALNRWLDSKERTVTTFEKLAPTDANGFGTREMLLTFAKEELVFERGYEPWIPDDSKIDEIARNCIETWKCRIEVAPEIREESSERLRHDLAAYFEAALRRGRRETALSIVKLAAESVGLSPCDAKVFLDRATRAGDTVAADYVTELSNQ